MLDQTVELCLADKVKKLKDACRTRWIQRIDSYTVSALVMALPAMVFPICTVTGIGMGRP